MWSQAGPKRDVIVRVLGILGLRCYSKVRILFRIVQIGADMSAEATEAATFIPEDPDEFASVLGFLATHEPSGERWHRRVTPL